MPHLTSGLPFVRFLACANCCLESHSASWSTQCFSKLYGCLRSTYRTHIIVLCPHQSRIGSSPMFQWRHRTRWKTWRLQCHWGKCTSERQPETGKTLLPEAIGISNSQCEPNVDKNRTWNSSSSLGYLNRKVPSIDKRMKITDISASLYHIANRGPQWFDAGFYYFNLTPSLPHPVKFPGWKMHGRAYKESIFWSYNALL